MNHLQDVKSRHSSFIPESKLFNRDRDILSTAEPRIRDSNTQTYLDFDLIHTGCSEKKGKKQCNCITNISYECNSHLISLKYYVYI